MENGNGNIKLDNVKSNDDFIAKGGDIQFVTYDYYCQPEIQFLITDQAKLRELVLFNKAKGEDRHMVIRPLFINRPSNKYMPWLLHMFNFQYNALTSKIYASTFKLHWDTFGSTPPKNMKDLSTYRQMFNSKFSKAMVEADFVIDIDANKTAIHEGKSTPEAEFLKTKEWACILHSYMVSDNIPHFVNFSGGAGFNIRIPASFLPPWTVWYKKAQKMAKHFGEIAGIPVGDKEGVDLGVYDTRRIFKVPYTLSNCKVVLPVNTKELEAYGFVDYDIVNFIKNQEPQLYNHFTTHMKTEDESSIPGGVVYDFGKEGQQKLAETIKRLK